MEEQEKLERVVLYARVSTEEQASKGVSIDAQIAALRTYAKLNNWIVADEYVDAGFSGARSDRPNVQRLLLDAKTGKFSVIAVAKLDRFYRNLRELLNTLHEIERVGVRFVATQESLDTATPNGKFSLGIMGIIAEWERGRIAERIKDGIKRRVELGRWKNGRTLYGYKWNSKEKRWEILEDEAKVVRYIYHLYTVENLGSERIPLRLNAEGLRTRQGAYWGFSAVNRILRHPAYKGRHPLGLELPVIVDEEKWELAQRICQQARSTKRRAGQWLLQGMVTCGLCGHTVRCRQAIPKQPRYYVCRGRAKDAHLDGSELCKLPWFPAEKIEEVVWNTLASALSNGDVLRQSIEDAVRKLETKRSGLAIEAAPLDQQLEKIKQKMERLGIAFADGAVRDDVYRAKLQTLREQEADLMARKANLDPESQLEVAELDSYIRLIKDVLDQGYFTLDMGGLVGLIPTKQGPVPADWFSSELLKGEQPKKGDAVEGVSITEEGDNVKISITEDAWGKIDEAWVKEARELLQFFQIKVRLFPDKAEIHGLLPCRLLAQVQLFNSFTYQDGLIMFVIWRQDYGG